MIVAAKQSFVAAGGIRVRAGELFDSFHPIPAKFPDLFEEPKHHVDVEQASAAPGESRTTKRSPPKSRTKTQPDS